MLIFRSLAVLLLCETAYSICFYCTVFSNEYIYNSNSSEFYEQESISVLSCPVPIKSMGNCPRDKSICKDKSYSQNSGQLLTSNMPFKTICSWTITLENKKSVLDLKLNSTGIAYIQINYNTKTTAQQISEHYTLSQYSKLSLKLSGSYFELQSYSYSRQSSIAIQIEWTQNNLEESQNSNSSSTLIVSVSCISTLIFIIFFVFCVCLYHRRKAARVISERAYQYVQGDYSNNSFIDSIISTNYAQNDLQDPCCICFDSILSGQYFRSLQCGHNFHSGCIEDWIIEKKSESFCPLCLKPIF